MSSTNIPVAISIYSFVCFLRKESPIRKPTGPTIKPSVTPTIPPIIKVIITATTVTSKDSFLSNLALYQAKGKGAIRDVIIVRIGTYTDIAIKIANSAIIKDPNVK